MALFIPVFHCKIREFILLKNGFRPLYTNVTLEIDTFIKNQKRCENDINFANNYKKVIKEQINSKKKVMLSLEDLKLIIYTINSDEEDLNFAVDMCKLHWLDKTSKFGNFAIGCELMKLFHFTKKCDIAVEVFTDKELEDFFNQERTLLVFLDLLFESGLYGEVLSFIDKMKDLPPWVQPFLMLAAGACYKINSADSLNKAIGYYNKMGHLGEINHFRPGSLIAALALKQGKPDTALEIIERIYNWRGTSMTLTLKAIALSELGRTLEAIIYLRAMLLIPRPPGGQSHSVFQEAEKIKNKIDKNDRKLLSSFDQIWVRFKQKGYICMETMEEKLCEEIDIESLLVHESRIKFLL